MICEKGMSQERRVPIYECKMCHSKFVFQLVNSRQAAVNHCPICGDTPAFWLEKQKQQLRIVEVQPTLPTVMNGWDILEAHKAESCKVEVPLKVINGEPVLLPHNSVMGAEMISPETRNYDGLTGVTK